VIDWQREAERSLPTGLDEITPEWVTLALRSRDETIPGIRGVDVARIGEGFGLTGAVGRVRLGWDRDDVRLPSSVIVKLPMAQSDEPSVYRKRAEQGSAATSPYFQRSAREVQFYRELAPSGDAPAPLCYFAAASEERAAIVLLLEDMADARQGDVLAGGSIQDVAAVIDAVAPFHARWWQPVSNVAGVPAWLPRWDGDPTRRHQRYRSRVEPFLERWGQTLDAEVVQLVRLMESRYGAVLRAIDERPCSVIHADLHLDNLLFHGEGEQARAVVLDWQSVSIGPIAIDLSTLITGSLSPADLRIGLDDLTERYSRALFTYSGVDYPAVKVIEDVRLALLWRLGGTVGWLSNADVDQLSGRERDLVIAALGDGRLANALVDLDVRSLLTSL